jgi:signal peptide peptidase SppA
MWNPFAARPPVVAVVRMEGVIAARAPGPFSAGALNAQSLAPALDRAFGLKRAAGVMLAINSPGGSPVQSSLIAARVRELAEEKKLPVVAVCEDAAASGGYWIACAADEIVADPASIVGSIGVISGGFGFQEAIARIGVERRLRTAGAEKSLLDPFSPETPEGRARQEELLSALHEEFKGWVRARRGPLFKAPEERLFTGRFWTGRQGLELGLVDRLGTLRGEARRRWGEKVRLVPVGGRRRRFPFLGGFGGEALAQGAARALEERAAWARLGL